MYLQYGFSICIFIIIYLAPSYRLWTVKPESFKFQEFLYRKHLNQLKIIEFIKDNFILMTSPPISNASYLSQDPNIHWRGGGGQKKSSYILWSPNTMSFNKISYFNKIIITINIWSPQYSQYLSSKLPHSLYTSIST